MKTAFKKAARLYKYLALLFSIVYWVYVLIDDRHFIEKYWEEHWLLYLRIWFSWFFVCLTTFTFYYWAAVSAGLLIYYKLIQRREG